MLNYLEFDFIDLIDFIDCNIGISLWKRNYIDGELLIVDFLKMSMCNYIYVYV